MSFPNNAIKGSCGFLGLPRLELVAHAGENELGKFRDAAIMDVIERHLEPVGVQLTLATCAAQPTSQEDISCP